MNISIKYNIIFFIFLCTGNVSAEERLISLEEAIKIAIENNIFISSKKSDVKIARYLKRSKLGEFIPRLDFQNNYETFNPAESNSKTDFNVHGSMYSELPTGGSVSLGLRGGKLNYFETNSDNFYTSAYATFSQPLLKNFILNEKYTEYKLAKLEEKKNEILLDQTKNTIIAQTIKAYLDLTNNESKSHVLQTSFEAMVKEKDAIKRKIELGILAQTDLTIILVQVEMAQFAYTASLHVVKKSKNDLKSLLNIDFEVRVSSDFSRAFNEEYDENICASNLELQEESIELEIEKTKSAYAKNQKLPDLDFESTVNFYSHESNSLADSYTGLSNFNNNTYVLGLRLSFPIVNTQANNEYYAQKEAENKQSTMVNAFKETLELTFANYLSNLELKKEHMKTAENIYVLNSKKYEAENKKFKAGKSNLDTVLRYRNDLQLSELGRLEARKEYVFAHIDLEELSGRLIER